MPAHTQTKEVPYTPEQMFDLVADIRRYPEFLPWCLDARVRPASDQMIYADVIIGFKFVRERWTSRVHLNRPNTINVEYVEGPFKHLTNHWTFTRLDSGNTQVDFHVAFEFRTALLDRMMGPLFTEAVRRMVSAFEQRASQLYGQASQPGRPGRPRQSTGQLG